MKLMARRKPAVPFDLGAAYLNSTPDPIILVQDGVVIDVNTATEVTYGFTRDELIGQYNTVFFPERQPCGTRSEELAGTYMKEMFSGGYARFTWTGVHKDGHQIPLILTAFMIKADEKDLVIITTQDYSLTNAMIVQLTSALKALAAGDLSSEIDQPFQAEYEPIRNNLNTAMENLRTLIGAVSDSAAAIRTGSGEIAQAAEDLARRTESGAAALEETAASLTQMDGRLRSSANAANQTVESADHAIVGVTSGRDVAEEAVQAMNRVSESAKGIDSVIEGLDKIAFQTRVLAMNAAVEAGRAGDAGRGFAVVADLVSALAMRAEEEAKRARDQLKLTQTDIVTAVEAVTMVDGALAGISGEVGEVHEKLSTMARDNQAQSAAITEISVAIGSMDQSTQQNAAMVEETSAAARNLATEVDHLARQASRFTTTRPSAARSGKVSQRPGGMRDVQNSIAARTQGGEPAQSAGRSYQAAALT